LCYYKSECNLHNCIHPRCNNPCTLHICEDDRCMRTCTDPSCIICIKRGDVNENGTVDDADVILLLRYLAGWDVKINEKAADINGDGKVCDIDVILLIRHLAWGIPIT